jgi:hypothetical protein
VLTSAEVWVYERGRWSAPVTVGPRFGGPGPVSCLSRSFCAAAGGVGEVVDPDSYGFAAIFTGRWSSTGPLKRSKDIIAMSCVPGVCMAIGQGRCTRIWCSGCR